jgi:hypothetical protein
MTPAADASRPRYGQSSAVTMSLTSIAHGCTALVHRACPHDCEAAAVPGGCPSGNSSRGR